MSKVKIVQHGGDNRDTPIRLFVNDKQVGPSVDYDQYGSAGREIIEEVAQDLARIFGVAITFTDEEEADD